MVSIWNMESVNVDKEKYDSAFIIPIMLILVVLKEDEEFNYEAAARLFWEAPRCILP